MNTRFYEANIRKIYVGSFLLNAVFFLPIIVLFWQANGLSFTQIMLLQTLFSLALLLFELPAGFFADTYGRKGALVLSALFFAAGAFLYAVGSTFFQFLVAEVVWALASSLLSGSDSAFVYDTLKTLKREKQYSRVIGTVLFLAGVATAIGSFIGGLLGAIHFRIAIAGFVPFALLSALVFLTIKEPVREKVVSERGHLHVLLRSVKFALIRNGEVRWLILYFAFLNLVGQIAFLFLQPYLVETGLPLQFIGVAFSLLILVMAFSSKYAHRIEQALGRRLSLFMLPFLSAGSLLAMGAFPSQASSIIFIAFLAFVWGFSVPVVEHYINQIVWSDKRATVLSLNNMSAGLLFAVLAPFAGKVADAQGVAHALLWLGFLSLISGLFMVLFFFKRESKERRLQDRVGA